MSLARRAACMLLALALVLAAGPAGAADKPDPLARARQLYNQRDYDGALKAATEARLFPGRADAADLVAARAYLERFRVKADPEDLTRGRESLGRIDPQRLGSWERVEYIVGLGESLYFDDAFGAAADIFDSLLFRDDLAADARSRMIDWWATSVDQDARARSDIERQQMYQRIRDRMQRELGIQPGSTAAAYWLSAAARAQGDVQAAWDAALSGWLRAALAPDHGDALRADIDQLVLLALVPERARALAQTPDAIRSEWERFKERWSDKLKR